MSLLCRNFVFLLGTLIAHSQSSVSAEQRSQKTKEQISGIFYFFHVPKINYLCTFQLVCFVFLFAINIHSQPNESTIIKLCEIIENKKVEKKLQQQAIRDILNIGKSALPIVEKRFRRTKNPHYFYIIESLQKNDLADKSSWEKQKYFYEHYQKAQNLYRDKKYEKAQEIIKSILILEPEISFKKELDQLSEKIKIEQNPDNNILATDIYPTAKYFSFEDELNLIISIKNLHSEQIDLYLGRPYVDFKITSKEFYSFGNNKTLLTTSSVPIKNKISISGGSKWEVKIKIPQNYSTKNCYQEMDVSIRIRLVTLEKEKKKYFPKIEFPITTIKVFPKKYHVIASNPISYFSGAIWKKNTELLFYSSFWVEKKEKKKAISILIENLEGLSLSPLVRSILVRFTKENFSTSELWKNWWRAHKSFF